MAENKKTRKKSRGKSSIKKSMNLMLVAGVATPGMVGVVGVQDAEAASITTYYWAQYSTWTETVSVKVASGLNEAAARAMAAEIGGYYRDDVCWCGTFDVFRTYDEKRVGGQIGEVSSTSRGAYPDGFSGDYYYQYLRSEVTYTNSAPRTPVITIPNVPFEHGDKQLISISASDPDNDPLTLTLQATYDEGKTWANVYSGAGANKVVEYVVPSDKMHVQFRVIASDGKLTTTSAVTPKKDIQELQYYWSKFNNYKKPIYELLFRDTQPHDGSVPTGTYYLDYEFDSNTGEVTLIKPTGTLTNGGIYQKTIVNVNGVIYYDALVYYNGHSKDIYLPEIKSYEDVKGTLVQNNLQGGYNAYQHGQKNPDGYWYERGQRVLAEDTTPPIIEWSEQADYGPTSTINVKVHDLSNIKLVRYAKGEQPVSYFGGEPLSGDHFTVSENGKYTLYAEDEKGNKAVEIVNVTKVNQKPIVSKAFEAITIQGKGKSTVIDLKNHFQDPDDHPLTFTVVSSSEAHVKATIENGSLLKVTGMDKGESKLTITATDGFEMTTVQVDVTVSNTKPTLTVEELPNHVVLDDQTHFTIDGTAGDEDSDVLTAKVKHLGKELTAPVSDGKFSVKYQGNQVSKGYHHDTMQVSVSDGLEDSDVYSATLPIIKVEDAANYTNEMAGHQATYNTWTSEQHEAFYNAYESIFNYEANRTVEALSQAKDAIAALRVQTVEESETITNWENRLAVVTATVATENAEKSLIKDDFKHAKELVEALTPSAEKEALVDRIDELQRYHDANDAITSMEEDHSRISWDAIEDAKEKVAVVENPTNQQNLDDRLTQIIKDYVSELPTVTPEDLDKFGVKDVNPDNGDFYNEYKDVFQPLGENTNAQDLVDFVNALKIALRDVTPSAVNTLHSKVPAYAEAALTPVLTTVDELLSYRQTFKREPGRDQALANHVQGVDFPLTNAYMQTMVTAMQEVIEYNDTHDDGEKSEAHTATAALWDGQLRTDMQAYLDNGIPDILVVDDRFEYINNGQLQVIATINDTNDTEHDVTVTFNGESKTLKTTDGNVAVTFELTDGVYDGYVEISAKDKLTERQYTISTKPVVTVSDVEMFKRFVQALEADKTLTFDKMDHSMITALKTLYDKTLAIQISVSSEREIREVENSASKMGGKNGNLETLVKSLIQDSRLIWLITNYKTATDDDFAWVGVVGVTPENINALRSIIDDYVASFEGRPVQTPTVEDYQTWLNLSEVIEEAQRAITAAEALHTQEELKEAIATAEEKLDKVPSWLTAKQALRTQLDAVIAYFNVIDSVVQAETSYLQADKDTAQQLVDQLPAGTPKDNLLTRLAAVQTVIDATLAVEQAETSLEEADQVTAQALVDAIDPVNAKQKELQARLDALVQLKEAMTAVEEAEGAPSQEKVDKAKELVEALPESPKKEELLNRLEDLQEELENKSKEDQAKDAVSKAEDSLQAEDRDKAQEKVDALEDGALKTELQDRLDALEEHVDAYPAALQAVEQAEQSKAQVDVETAQPLVEALPSSKAKTNLQERLDLVSQFIQAEGAVSKAEASLIQKHKNEAQVLVDALPTGADKKALQNRLDALQKAIDEKKEDLLDKIINDLDSVTAEELADYTGEDVYEELLPEYLEEIGKLGDSVTKEQIIEIIKVINSLELSKREMLLPYIDAYGKEYAAATLPTLHTYPQPTALSSVVDYLHDDEALEQVIKEIATALKVPEDEIRAEIEKILQDVSDDVTTGKYLVQYVTAEGEVIAENWVTEVPYGEVMVEGLAPEGYELIGEAAQSFILSDETVGQIVSFTVQAKEVEESNDKEGETEQPTVPDKEKEQPNDDDSVTEEETQEDVETTVKEIANDDISLNTLTAEQLRTFTSETVDFTTIEDDLLELYVQHLKDYAVEQELTSYTNEAFNQLLKVIHAAYEQEATAAEKIATLQDGDVKDTLMALLQPKSTIGSEASLVRSQMMVASLNDRYLQVTATPYGQWGTENENHAEYVFKTFYALASVKSYQATPTEKYREEVKDYIAKELHDGSYKEMLLGELGYRIDEIGTNDDGIPDLTVVKPTKPPVITPPVVEPPVVEPIEPPIVTPPVVDPPPVVNPQPKPEPPVVKPEPELPDGTVAETINYDDKGKWTIKNPAKDVLTLEQDGVQIKIPLELQAKLWEVEWIPKANQHYQLRIWADGKEVKTFKKPIEITKTSKKAYVLRFENSQYKAVPFTFAAPNQLQFKVTKTGEFQFSTKRITFKDIEGVFSQQAIEELASRHIVNGTAPGYYSPHDSLTRAQFSAMLVRALGLDTEGEKGVFKDVKATDWFAEDVQALYATGIIKGATATKFNPNSPLTRQQAALMLDRVLDYIGVEKELGSLNFIDASKISKEAQSAVAVMQAMGIFSGKEGNTFDPHAQLTRAEMAKVLQLTLKIVDLY